MTEETPSIGQRFSHLYVERGTPVSDSPRLRRRAVTFLGEHLDKFLDEPRNLANYFHRELGLDVPYKYNFYDFKEFFACLEIVDFLDCVTLVWRFFHYERNRAGVADLWRSFLNRVMDEENVAYQIDEAGGAHFRPDEEFERNRASALACLQGNRYAAVRDAFEAARAGLDRNDGKGAIRSAFEAVETLAKLIAGDTKIARLGPSEVEKVLKPLARQFYGSGTPEGNAAGSLLGGLSDWINAAQQYRHGQRIEEPATPPQGIAVAMTSTAATYIRWLVEIDQRTAVGGKVTAKC